MLVKANEKINKNGLSNLIDLIVCDIESPPLKDNSFDAYIIYGVLHHVSDPGVAIKNASKKLVNGGLFYSIDPHDSPVRFIFDFLMDHIWKLWDEEASDDPLLTKEKFDLWFSHAGITASIKISTYIPPHLFNFMNFSIGKKVLKISDSVFSEVDPKSRTVFLMS